MSSWQKNWRRKWSEAGLFRTCTALVWLSFLGAVWLHQGCILTSSIKILPSLLFLSTPYFSIFSLSFKHQCLLHVSSFKYLFLDLAGTCHFLYLDTHFFEAHGSSVSCVIVHSLHTTGPLPTACLPSFNIQTSKWKAKHVSITSDSGKATESWFLNVTPMKLHHLTKLTSFKESTDGKVPHQREYLYLRL